MRVRLRAPPPIGNGAYHTISGAPLQQLHHIQKTMFFKKRPDSAAFRRDMAKMLDGKAIKYVTERTSDGETVIGRSGALIVKGGELLVYSSADVVFRCLIAEMNAGELMSRGGVIITAPDIGHGGLTRTVTAYFTDHLVNRK